MLTRKMKTHKKIRMAALVLVALGITGTPISAYEQSTPITAVDITSHDDYDVVWNGNQYTVTCTESTDEDLDGATPVSDPVTHTWSGAGTFSPTIGTSVTWSPPDTSGQVTVTVTASDSPLYDDTDVSDSVTFTLEAGRNVKQAPYNAAGDGVTDDSDEIQDAINSTDGDAIVLLKDGTFAVNSMIDLISNTTLIGENATLKNISRNTYGWWSSVIDPVLEVHGDCEVNGLTIDGNDRRIFGITINNEDNVLIENCTIQNLKSTDDINSVIGIYLWRDTDNVKILSCDIKNLYVTTDDAKESALGILLRADAYEVNDLVIEDCNFENIRCVGSTNGNCIYLQAYDGSNPFPFVGATINNCYFTNYSTRGLKLQCAGVTVTNNKFEDPNCDYVALGSGVSSYGDSMTITDNEFYFSNDDGMIGIGVKYGKNNTIEDNTIVVKKNDVNSNGIFLYDANDNTITSNVIRGCYGLKFFVGSQGNVFTNNTLDVNTPVYYRFPDPNNDNNNTIIPNTLPWDSSESYSVNEKVLHLSVYVYECMTAHTNQEPPNTTYWDFVEIISWNQVHNTTTGTWYTTINGAIEAASSGDEIVAHPGTYHETVDFDGKAITVSSFDPNDPNVVAATIIDANGSGTVVTFESSEDANSMLKGFTITGGSEGGIYCYGASPTISKCVIIGNETSGTDDGAGMYNYYSDPNVLSCIFTGNQSAHDGGGMANYYSDPRVVNCTFSNNTAYDDGGGMYSLYSHPVVTDCTFTDNTSTDDGGGLNSTNCHPVLTNCTFSGNSAGSDGGGVRNNWAEPNFIECTFINNTAYDDGGGMYSEECTIILDDCIFSQNTAGDNGGGMYYEDTDGTVTSCVFWDNNCVGDGGGMYNDDYCPTLINCTFALNESLDGNGGGIFNRHVDVSDAILINCIIYYNDAEDYGDEIYNDDSDPTFSYCDVDDCGGSEDWDPDCGIDGGNNIDESPDFEDRYDGDGDDDLWRTCDDGLNLDSSSDCIDEGSNGAAEEDYDDKDIKGSDRIINNTVDMGAYENDPNC